MEIKKLYDASVLTKEEMKAEKAYFYPIVTNKISTGTSYAKLVNEGECLADNRYEYTDKVITLK